ncbi:MAG TPA: hypothetical protein DHW42_05985 [Candidatus Marinimicrobia bacterium]|nr:hypothetical protein [Candidatus Neomarinimicrobiota bacterium]
MKTAEDILNEKDRSIISIQQNATVYDALKLMVKKNIGAIVVKDNDDIVGIYTERDLMKDTVKKKIDVQKAIIKDYMISTLYSAPYDEPIYLLLDKILGKRIRHIFVEKEGKYVGILSAGDVTKACLNERTKEMESVSWDYYENWRWKPTRK